MDEPSNSLPPEPLDNYTSHLVNYKQTPEERRAKYWLCRSLGKNSYWSIKMRDWRLSKIERTLGLVETYDPHTKTYNRNMTLNSQIAIPV